MEDCNICYTNQSTKKLPCNHELCSECCVRLNSAICPFCRSKFTFNAIEMKQRISLGLIHGYNWEQPPVIRNNNSILPNRQLHISEEYEANEPFSRIINNGTRRRRRALSLDEVLERRKEINERKARHWDRKDARLRKLTAWWEV